MFFKKKPKTTIDPQQVTLVEHAQQRIAQKKRFNNHLLATLFLVFFAFVLNFAFEYKADFTPFNTHWSFALAALLGVFLLIHFIKVYVFYTFMGKAWEKPGFFSGKARKSRTLGHPTSTNFGGSPQL